jgi:hypothetical protein
VFVLILTALTLACRGKHPNCNDVKTGTFETMSRDAWVIKTETIQIEKTKTNDNFYVQWKLKYINDCEYFMIFDFQKSTDKIVFAPGDTIKISLGEILPDRYFWTAVYKGKTYKGHNYFIKK